MLSDVGDAGSYSRNHLNKPQELLRGQAVTIESTNEATIKNAMND